MMISPAFAQSAGGSGDIMGQMLPLILIFFVFYFVLIRPQQKRQKEHKSMLGALKRGDRIVTGGGIIGQVVKATDVELTVEIADNVKIRVTRDSVMGMFNEEAAQTAAAAASNPNTDKTKAGEDGAEGEGEDKSSGSKLRRMLGGK
jgi:preprotein translocase subunit YajC